MVDACGHRVRQESLQDSAYLAIRDLWSRLACSRPSIVY